MKNNLQILYFCKMNILLSTSYLPPIEYIQAICKSETIFIEGYESFPKQSYRNRTHILTSQGILALSIPICKYSNHEITKNICISYDIPWQHQHLNTLMAAYNSSPFFEFYLDFFHPFYEQKYRFLIDYNTDYLKTLLKLLNIDNDITITSTYEKDIKTQLDLRTAFHPKKGINLPDTLHKDYHYQQVFTFEKAFIPHLSIIDLLCNTGPQYQSIIL